MVDLPIFRSSTVVCRALAYGVSRAVRRGQTTGGHRRVHGIGGVRRRRQLPGARLAPAQIQRPRKPLQWWRRHPVEEQQLLKLSRDVLRQATAGDGVQALDPREYPRTA